MSRTAAHKPATAWEYRRAIELVQILAMDRGQVRTDALYALATAWDVEIDVMLPMIHDLAVVALEAAQSDGDSVG